MAATESFYYVVLDIDTGNFTVEGPMYDDTKWDQAVSAAQDAGRNVKCAGSSPASSRAEVVEQMERRHGGEELPRGSIVRP
jgi:hypothetical protein